MELRRALRRTRLPSGNDEGRARSSIAHRRKEVRNPRGRALGMGTGWAGPAASPAHLGRGSRPEYVAERPPICRRLQLLDLGGGLWTEQIAAPRGRSASHQRGAINLASSSLKDERDLHFPPAKKGKSQMCMLVLLASLPSCHLFIGGQPGFPVSSEAPASKRRTRFHVMERHAK